MTVEVQSLEDHIERLLTWLARVRTIPPWKEKLVLDTSDPRVRWVTGEDHGWRAPEDALRSVASFASRFDRLQRMGYAWINLGAYGIFRGDLVFGIELPQAPVGVPPGRTSVNYSGPNLDVRTGEPVWALRLELDSPALR